LHSRKEQRAEAIFLLSKPIRVAAVYLKGQLKGLTQIDGNVDGNCHVIAFVIA